MCGRYALNATGRMAKLEFEVRDALLRYSKRSGKKVIKEI
jgi:hypothetical protein